MFPGGRFAVQVTEAVDGIETNVIAFLDCKVCHVGHKGTGIEALSLESRVTELNRLLI